MIEENAIFWQSIVFLLWGYICSWLLHYLVAFPSRLLETS